MTESGALSRTAAIPSADIAPTAPPEEGPEPGRAVVWVRPARLDGLTVLRALAATGVVLFHFHQGIFGSVADLGRDVPFVDRYYLGVDLFFILSGFVLAHVHGGDFAALRPRPVVRFYILRLARIYPVHAVMMMAFLAVYLAQRLIGQHFGIELRARASHYSARSFLAHMALLHPYGLNWNFPAWSVSAEWFAYLWFPLLAFALMRARRRWSMVALAAVAAGFALVYDTVLADNLDHPGLLRVVFEFIAGFLLYRACYGASTRRLLMVAAAPAMLGLAALPTRFSDFGAVLLLGTAVALAGHRPLPPLRRRAFRPLLWLGNVSYSLYMVQALVIGTVGRVLEWLLPRLSPAGQFALVPLLLAFAIFCAGVLHRTVEQPARDLLRGWLMRTARSARDRWRMMASYQPLR